MAVVTWIIGNGFDLGLGLKTRYVDFYGDYIKKASEIGAPYVDPKTPKGIFLKSLADDSGSGYATWGDFEFAMGKKSDLFGTGDDFIGILDDVIESLSLYLQNEVLRIEYTNIKNLDLQAVKRALTLEATGFTSGTISNLKAKIPAAKSTEKTEINVLQFNYTQVLDRLLKKITDSSEGFPSLNENVHLHGSLGGFIVLGVDNDAQISKSAFKTDTGVTDYCVKGNYINILRLGTIRKALSIIGRSDIIIVYGSSLGATDLTYWQAIGDRLKQKNNPILVIANVLDLTGTGIKVAQEGIAKETDHIKNRFLSLSGQNKAVSDRIFVELNRGVFNIDLPLRGRA